jgi:hypothetical protein
MASVLQCTAQTHLDDATPHSRSQNNMTHIQRSHTTTRIIRMSRLVPGGRLCLILLTLVMTSRVSPCCLCNRHVIGLYPCSKKSCSLRLGILTSRCCPLFVIKEIPRLRLPRFSTYLVAHPLIADRGQVLIV